MKRAILPDITVEPLADAQDVAFWRSLVERSPVAVAVIGEDGRFAYANPCAVGLYGTPDRETLVGRPAALFVMPGDAATVRSMFFDVLSGQTILGRRWRLVRHGGDLVDVEINAGPIEVRGRPAVQIELRDISAQVAAESALVESELRWRTVFDGSPVGIAVSDEHGRVVAANASLCSLLGRGEGELVGHGAAEFTHPDDLPTHARAGSMIVESVGGVARIEKRYLRPDGSARWAWLTVTHIPGPTGQTWTLAHAQDVTDRKAAEQSAADSRTNLRAVGEVIRQIQGGGDARQTIVDAGMQLADAAYVSLLEPTADGAHLHVTATTHLSLIETTIALGGGRPTARVFSSGEPLFLADAADDPRVSPDLRRLTTARSVYLLPVRSEEAVTGVLIVAWDHIVPDLDDRRAEAITLLVHHAGVALRQASLMTELESLALSDPLTSLPNRRSWDERLMEAMEVARRNATPLTVALADVDHFKAFNDTHGHPAGDEVLRRAAGAMRTVLRAGDSIARWGGEEFAIALPGCQADEAGLILDRLRRAMPEGQTCSIGFATWDGVEDHRTLLARTDEALYAAKHSGRDQVVAAAR